MTKRIKGYYQNMVNHIITTLFGFLFIAAALGFLIYDYWSKKTMDLTVVGVSVAIIIIGLALMGAQDRINIFKKNVK